MSIGKQVVTNASWIIVCKIVQALVSLVISMIVARYLGPTSFGLISYAGALVAFVVPIAQLGFNSIIVQEIVSTPEKEGEILGTSIVLSSISSLACMLGIYFFTLFVNAGEEVTITVCTLYSISLLFQMTEMVQYWYQAKLLSKYVAIVSLVSRIAVSAYKIIIIISGKSIYWFAIVNSLDFLLISVMLTYIYYKKGRQRFRFSLKTGKSMFSKSKHFIIAGLMVSVFGQTDRIMLKLMIGDEVSGYYAAAITCAGMTSFVFIAILESLRPVIFSNKKDNAKSYENNVCTMFSIILYMALVQSIMLAVAAKPIISVLYGYDYLSSAAILQVITWYSAFSYLGSARNVWMLAEGKEAYIWSINLSGAVLNFVGNLIMIPICGALGAALVSVITQFFTNFIMCFLIKPMRECGFLMIKAMNPKYVLQAIKKINLYRRSAEG